MKFNSNAITLIKILYSQLRSSLTKAFHRGHKKHGHKKDQSGGCPTPDRLTDRETPSPLNHRTSPTSPSMMSLVSTPSTSDVTPRYFYYLHIIN